MALSKLSGDEQGIIFSQLCNVLDPRVAVALNSVSHELREPTHTLLQQLRAGHEAALALCPKLGMRSCKELREARIVGLEKMWTTADLATLGSLGSVLPALTMVFLSKEFDGVQRLAEGLGVGALPAVTRLSICGVHVGDEGASALAAALGRGAMPRLKHLSLDIAAIGDAGLVALAPALRRLPALEELHLMFNPFGDEGLVALVAPPPPAGAPPPPAGAPPPPAGAPPPPAGALSPPTARSPSPSSPTRFSSGLERLPCEFCQIPQPLARLTRHQQACPQRGGAPSQHAPLQRVPPIGELTKLKLLQLNCTKVTDAGCAILASAVDNGALPALRIGELFLFGTPGEAAAKTFRSKAFYRVLAK